MFVHSIACSFVCPSVHFSPPFAHPLTAMTKQQTSNNLAILYINMYLISIKGFLLLAKSFHYPTQYSSVTVIKWPKAAHITSPTRYCQQNTLDRCVKKMAFDIIYVFSNICPIKHAIVMILVKNEMVMKWWSGEKWNPVLRSDTFKLDFSYWVGCLVCF